MRLVAWNANYNRHRRALEDDVAILRQFDADVLVISETAPPRTENPCGAVFTGGTPGLAVIARDGVTIEPYDVGDAPPRLSLGFRIVAPWRHDVIAVWPVSGPGMPSYHEVLMATLEHFGPLLTPGRAIMAGDFNSSSRVVAQAASHPSFVARAAECGLVSAYHEITGEAHGKETIGTYRHGAGNSYAYHLDYCFVSRPLLSSIRYRVCDDPSWDALSDHRPVVLDVEEPAGGEGRPPNPCGKEASTKRKEKTERDLDRLQGR